MRWERGRKWEIEQVKMGKGKEKERQRRCTDRGTTGKGACCKGDEKIVVKTIR